ncbi:unnamed protein product [Musa acuminata subsp. burmannicoides]
MRMKTLNQIATVKDDGTVVVDVPSNFETKSINLRSENIYGEAVDEEPVDLPDLQYRPPMQIVILIVGTRGDVQPFVAIGKCLQNYINETRVPIVKYMKKKAYALAANPIMPPSKDQHESVGIYIVCNREPKQQLLPNDPVQDIPNKPMISQATNQKIPFKVDAIIANPPAYGHTHVAEALKVPIHIFFTMPWTPTSEFPHPLSRVKQSVGYRLSYQIVDSVIWLGICDMINDFRKQKLKLQPVTYLSGVQTSASDIPYGYIWSPHLVPKPKDWGPKIDVVGFCFLDLASNYEPPESLVDWLNAGEKPVYIGFGSLGSSFCYYDPVQEPGKMTEIIVEALKITGQRGIINKGWGGLGNLAEPKDYVYLLDNVPHDWLFPQCKAVVHHGGAGTTAAGLRAACPTTIVPFFGDQPSWGERVHARGLGPPPIPVDQFSLEKLVDAIMFMMTPKVKENAVQLAKAMETEDGVSGAVKAFLKHLPPKISPQVTPEPSSFVDFLVAPIRRCFFSPQVTFCAFYVVKERHLWWNIYLYARVHISYPTSY